MRSTKLSSRAGSGSRDCHALSGWGPCSYTYVYEVRGWGLDLVLATRLVGGVLVRTRTCTKFTGSGSRACHVPYYNSSMCTKLVPRVSEVSV